MVVLVIQNSIIFYFLLTNHDTIIALSKNHNSRRHLSVFTINSQTQKQKIITIASHNGNIIQFVSLFLFHIQCSHLIQFMFSNFFNSIFIFLGVLSQGFTNHSRKAFVYIFYTYIYIYVYTYIYTYIIYSRYIYFRKLMNFSLVKMFMTF